MIAKKKGAKVPVKGAKKGGKEEKPMMSRAEMLKHMAEKKGKK